MLSLRSVGRRLACPPVRGSHGRAAEGGVVRYAVLLRGVNVGGAHRVRMADLRELLAAAGCRDVATYVQSGNAAVDWDGDAASLEERTREGLRTRVGLDVAVMARSAAEMDAVVAGNPLGEPDDPKLLHVAFLSAQPDAERLAGLEPDAWAPDRLAVGDRVLYLAYTAGMRDSPLTRQPPRLGVQATARNWRTVLAVRDLIRGR
ncbi:MAG: DUF1697 domain-containing protein [Actinomycetota bacterium]|nr:DUF1697 domain-containing protein [Actinomycetota bacterium]